MRLFIALALPPELKSALTDAQRAMAAQGVKGNYSPEENLHLTLAFIGEVPDAQAAAEALEAVSFAPFPLTLRGLGRFDDSFWAGVEPSPALDALARRVRRALAKRGVPFDRKRFAPHITLLRRASKDPAGIAVAPARMRVETVSLFRSDRGKTGMRYTELLRVPADRTEEDA